MTRESPIRDNLLKLFRVRMFALLLGGSMTLGQQTKGTSTQNNYGGTNYQYNYSRGTDKQTERELRAAAKKVLGDENEWQGILIPGHNPTPMKTCEIPPGAIGISLGQKATIVCEHFPCSVIAYKDASTLKSLLWIDRSGGVLLVEAQVFDKGGNIIATIEHNKFFTNQSHAFKSLHPDVHSLLIKDEQNHVALNATFLNESAMQIEGRFFDDKGHSLWIDPDHLSTDGNGFLSNACFSDTRVKYNAEFYLGGPLTESMLQ
jgi:hypothetical protein